MASLYLACTCEKTGWVYDTDDGTIEEADLSDVFKFFRNDAFCNIKAVICNSPDDFEYRFVDHAPEMTVCDGALKYSIVDDGMDVWYGGIHYPSCKAVLVDGSVAPLSCSDYVVLKDGDLCCFLMETGGIHPLSPSGLPERV